MILRMNCFLTPSPCISKDHQGNFIDGVDSFFGRLPLVDGYLEKPYKHYSHIFSESLEVLLLRDQCCLSFSYFLVRPYFWVLGIMMKRLINDIKRLKRILNVIKSISIVILGMRNIMSKIRKHEDDLAQTHITLVTLV